MNTKASINSVELTKKETIALLVAGICGSITNPSDQRNYIFLSQGKRHSSNWIDTVLQSLSRRINGLHPHFDKNDRIVPGCFWVSREISEWADDYPRNSQAYIEFHKMCCA